jgi:imidazolonepropionase-like amidohydrolase
MKRRLGLGLALWLAAPAAWAQGGATPRVHALVHARVVAAPGSVQDDATIVIRDGVVTAVGRRAAVPADARVWNLAGRSVYPGLIEAWFDPTPPPRPAGGRGEGGRGGAADTPGADGGRGATHANARVKPEHDVATGLDLDSDAVGELRSLGFTAVHLVPASGVFRGRSAVVLLRDGTAAQQLLRPRVAQILAFERDNPGPGSRRAPVYPNSIMGSVALVRQTLLDAGWARAAQRAYSDRPGASRPHDDVSLQALAAVLPAYDRQPLWVQTGDVLGCLRADAVAREFGLDMVLLGNGDESRRLDALRDTKRTVIVPVDFPEPPRIDPGMELDVDLELLRYWDGAAANPGRVHAAGIPLALTSHRLRKRAAFPARVRQAIERGLAPDAALAALTTVPAKLLGAERELGRIAPGALANLTVTDGELFTAEGRIVEVWVEGDRYEIRPAAAVADSLAGEWNLELDSGGRTAKQLLRVTGSAWTLSAEVGDERGVRALEAPRFSAGELQARDGDRELRVRLADKRLQGVWVHADGTTVPVRGQRARASAAGDVPRDRAAVDADAERPSDAAPPAGIAAAAPAPAWPPLPPPAPRAVMVRNATIWTSGPQGVLTGADLVASGGRITAIGRGLAVPRGAEVIDATGMHLTPGLIDCHSHSNIVGGVNEATHNCTAEVRVADVINSESIALYRELAGGLTVANQLHGSANAIGGQNAVVKLRWGEPPARLLFAEAPPGIKFALGENPKQSNWDDRNDRYPQTRLGVEQSIRERFMAARDYARAWDDYKRGAVPPRRDLQLEAVAEILRGERLVHCHSYRADEILMMTRLAEEFGVRIATFQHVLEGYKVADELAAHGAGASAFSDWWAYKFEVIDGIPYAGAILHERGVLTSFNSDSADLARRLNLEAAKAVKYGGVPEADALHFVTINPAKQLRIDRWVGSLETGKHADFALWNGHPLSPATRCEQTWIEGRRYFDRNADLQARPAMEAEREALIARARAARKKMKRDELDRASGWRPAYWAGGFGESCHEEERP